MITEQNFITTFKNIIIFDFTTTLSGIPNRLFSIPEITNDSWIDPRNINSQSTMVYFRLYFAGVMYRFLLEMSTKSYGQTLLLKWYSSNKDPYRQPINPINWGGDEFQLYSDEIVKLYGPYQTSEWDEVIPLKNILNILR